MADDAGRVRQRVRRRASSAAAAARRRSTWPQLVKRVGRQAAAGAAPGRRARRMSPAACAPSTLHAGARAADRGRAGQRAGQPQGQAAAAGRRLRRHPAAWRASRWRAARTCSTCCVALTERADEAAQMRAGGQASCALSIEAPLVIDTTEADVIEAALESYPGRAIINSINLERGRERIEAVLPLAREHGAAVVALTIDEIGMAQDRRPQGRGLQAHLRHLHAASTACAPTALIFDVLTFPVTTGQEDLRDVGAGDARGHPPRQGELPGVLTILGVSNVSFGLTPHARAVLNSRLPATTPCRPGWTWPSSTRRTSRPTPRSPPRSADLADDLLLNRAPDALPRFIAYFEGTRRRQTAGRRPPTRPAGMTVERADPLPDPAPAARTASRRCSTRRSPTPATRSAC